MKRPSTQKLPLNLVKHPRYGAQPLRSGLVVAEEEIRHGHWRYQGSQIFPDTVLAANVALQNYCLYPRRYYVDMLKECRRCGRPFIFFAREQRHWFETLRFYVDADCVECPECRSAFRLVQRRLRRYSALLRKTPIVRKELMILVDDALFLFRQGVVRDLSALGMIKNRAVEMIPEYPDLRVLEEALREAHDKV